MTSRGETVTGYVRTAESFISVRYLPHGDQRWRGAHPVYPDDRYGSCVAIVAGAEVIVVFGWHDGRALLWRSEGTEIVAGDLIDARQLPILADLGDGAVELNGPKARWRWRMVT